MASTSLWDKFKEGASSTLKKFGQLGVSSSKPNKPNAPQESSFGATLLSKFKDFSTNFAEDKIKGFLNPPPKFNQVRRQAVKNIPKTNSNNLTLWEKFKQKIPNLSSFNPLPALSKKWTDHQTKVKTGLMNVGGSLRNNVFWFGIISIVVLFMVIVVLKKAETSVEAL